MIVSPDNWKEIGQPISLQKIENTLLEILAEIPCSALSLSGGVDSSLLLYYMNKVKKNIITFTMGKVLDHADVIYAQMAIESMNKDIKHNIYIPDEQDIRDIDGGVYKLFYKYVSKYADSMIAGDGVDEFMCGYYDHQKNQTEEVYYDYLRRLKIEHLVPLDKESNDVKVYLPYIDRRVITLFSQIPIMDKVDDKSRKKIIMALAKDKLPSIILERWKYGFCDALNIKERKNESNS